jgi:hypothetical protein
MDLDEAAKECGFENAQDLHRCVAHLPLTDPIVRERFEQWKEADGTKDGLLKLCKSVLFLESAL